MALQSGTFKSMKSIYNIRMKTHILHVSDTHLGKTQYGSNLRAEDYAIAFDTTIDIAIEENVDAVVHTGDLFDDRQPNTNTISKAFSTVKRLEKENIPFLAIVGNHERKWDKQWIDIFKNLDNVHRLSPDEPFVINDSVSIFGFDSFRNLEWDNTDFELNIESKNNAVLLCMHELFKELIPPVKAKRTIEPVFDKINVKPDAIALGDYHAAVDEVIQNTPVFYSGATERTSATTADPTIRMIKFDGNKLQSYPWRKIEGVRENVPRPFYTLDISLNDNSTRSYIKRVVTEDIPVEELNESVVVLNITGSTDSSVTPKEAYSVLESLGIPVPYINDKRSPESLQFESYNSADPTEIDIDNMIENEIGDTVSDTVKEIETNYVRDLSFTKSHLRPKIEEKFEEGEIQ